MTMLSNPQISVLRTLAYKEGNKLPVPRDHVVRNILRGEFQPDQVDAAIAELIVSGMVETNVRDGDTLIIMTAAGRDWFRGNFETQRAGDSYMYVPRNSSGQPNPSRVPD